MKLTYTILFGWFWISGIHCQIPELIYDCRKDSNDYISNLKIINGEIYFNSGKVRNPKGVYFCTSGMPAREFRERHVYKLNDDNTCSKIFHHYLENDFAKPEEQFPDSSNIFNRSTFIEFSDTSGIFLFDSGKSEYWIKKKNVFYKENLPESEIVSSYYPKWYNENLIVRGNDSISDGRLWHFNKTDLRLKKMLSDTFLYKAHNLSFYNQNLIFHGYSKVLDKDHALFVADKRGTITKITDFDPATIFVQYQTIYKGKLIYRIVHRGVVDSYSNKDFTNTELWEYDFNSKKNKKIYDFGKYGLTHSSTVFGENLYFVYGLKNYRLFELNQGDITETNDVSNTLDSIKYTHHDVNKIGDNFYFAGQSKDKKIRLYSLNIDGSINLVDKKLTNINYFQVIEDKLFFSTYNKENKIRKIYVMESNNKVEKISEIGLPENEIHNMYFKKLANKIYLKVKREQKSIFDLFYFDDSKKSITPVLKDVKNTNTISGLELKILNNQIILISRANEKDRYCQIWKIK